MLAAGVLGTRAEKTVRGYKLPPDVGQELKRFDHDKMRQVLDGVIVTDGPSNGKKPIRRS
jgi:hypothetical protein